MYFGVIISGAQQYCLINNNGKIEIIGPGLSHSLAPELRSKNGANRILIITGDLPAILIHNHLGN